MGLCMAMLALESTDSLASWMTRPVLWAPADGHMSMPAGCLAAIPTKNILGDHMAVLLMVMMVTMMVKVLMMTVIMKWNGISRESQHHDEANSARNCKPTLRHGPLSARGELQSHLLTGQAQACWRLTRRKGRGPDGTCRGHWQLQLICAANLWPCRRGLQRCTPQGGLTGGRRGDSAPDHAAVLWPTMMTKTVAEPIPG